MIDYYSFRTAWLNSGIHTEDGVYKFLASCGLSLDENGVVVLPTGERIDLMMGAKAVYGPYSLTIVPAGERGDT